MPSATSSLRVRPELTPTVHTAPGVALRQTVWDQHHAALLDPPARVRCSRHPPPLPVTPLPRAGIRFAAEANILTEVKSSLANRLTVRAKPLSGCRWGMRGR